MPGAPKPSSEDQALARRYATERRRQFAVLLILAAAILLVSIFWAGAHNIFLPHWWHVDLP